MKDRINCVCMDMIYACRKCSESHTAVFLVCVFMLYSCIKCSKIHIAGFLGCILCTIVYRCIFVCSVVRRSGVTVGELF